MSTITITATIAGTINDIPVSETGSFVITARDVLTFTRDVSNTTDILSDGAYVAALITNIGSDQLCLQTGSINTPVPVGKTAVITGSGGKYDVGGAIYTIAAHGNISARSLTATGTRVRVVVIR